MWPNWNRSRVTSQILWLFYIDFHFRYIIVLSSTDSKCPHSPGLGWQFYDGSGFTEDPDMKIECALSKYNQRFKFKSYQSSPFPACSDDPPAAPSGSTSDWDSSTKAVGTLVTYTCEDVGPVSRSVCDAETQAWLPAAIPECWYLNIHQQITLIIFNNNF